MESGKDRSSRQVDNEPSTVSLDRLRSKRSPNAKTSLASFLLALHLSVTPNHFNIGDRLPVRPPTSRVRKVWPAMNIERTPNSDTKAVLPLVDSFMKELQKDWDGVVAKFSNTTANQMNYEEVAADCLKDGCPIEMAEEVLKQLKSDNHPNAELIDLVLRLEEMLKHPDDRRFLHTLNKDPSSVLGDRRKLLGLAILSLADDLLAAVLVGGGASKVPGASKLARLLGHSQVPGAIAAPSDVFEIDPSTTDEAAMGHKPRQRQPKRRRR